MWQIRELVLKLMKEMGISQAELCRLMNAAYRYYPLQASELSLFLGGKSTSPKAHRVMEDALKLLTKKKEQQAAQIASASKLVGKK